MYSCIRFTCTSNTNSGGICTPSFSRITAESCAFFCCFTALKAAMSASDICCFSLDISDRSVIKPPPMRSVMNSESSRLQRPSQRRWVMPLVLFWNLSGVTEYQSLNRSCLSISLCIWATPFT